MPCIHVKDQFDSKLQHNHIYEDKTQISIVPNKNLPW